MPRHGLELNLGSTDAPETLTAEIRLNQQSVVWIEAQAGGRAGIEIAQIALSDLNQFERLVDLLREAQAWVAPMANDETAPVPR